MCRPACRDPKDVAASFDEVVRKIRQDVGSMTKPRASRLAQARNILVTL